MVFTFFGDWSLKSGDNVFYLVMNKFEAIYIHTPFSWFVSLVLIMAKLHILYLLN